MGTGPRNACTPNGWPADPRPQRGPDRRWQLRCGAFGSTTMPRAEIAKQNGVVQIDDIMAFASRFGEDMLTLAEGDASRVSSEGGRSECWP